MAAVEVVTWCSDVFVSTVDAERLFSAEVDEPFAGPRKAEARSREWESCSFQTRLRGNEQHGGGAAPVVVLLSAIEGERVLQSSRFPRRSSWAIRRCSVGRCSVGRRRRTGCLSSTKPQALHPLCCSVFNTHNHSHLKHTQTHTGTTLSTSAPSILPTPLFVLTVAPHPVLYRRPLVCFCPLPHAFSLVCCRPSTRQARTRSGATPWRSPTRAFPSTILRISAPLDRLHLHADGLSSPVSWCSAVAQSQLEVRIQHGAKRECSLSLWTWPSSSNTSRTLI